MFRTAHPSDLPGLSALWQEAFGDSPAEIAAFFAAFPNCRSYTAAEGGTIAAMVHALPQTLRAGADLPAAYIYAVATRREFRGRGLCHSLMAFAEADLTAQGFSCAVLSPAEPSLFRFYASLGYAAAFTRTHTPWNGTGVSVSAARYAQLREALLPGPHMAYDENTLAYAQRTYGLTYYEAPNGCAAAGPDGAIENLPADLGGHPNAMIKWLDRPRTLAPAYLGFALE